MGIPTRQQTILTSHGSIAVAETGRGGIPVLLIHGNSFSGDVFRHQLRGRLAENHRLITFDLPGHGQSSNAPDPMRSYTRPGLADAAIELLGRLEVSEAIVLGWSLGGHVGVDPLVNLEYFETVAYANLWEGQCHRLAQLGHAPFWEAPDDFDPILERFLRDIETGRAGLPVKAQA